MDARCGVVSALLLALLPACSGGGGGGSAGEGAEGGAGAVGTGSATADGGAGNGCAEGQEPLAGDISIDEVAIYQAVKVPLAVDAQAVGRKAPVIAGRQALVRAFVTPNPGWASHEVTGVLTLLNGDEEITYEATRMPGDTAEDGLTTTFNFNVAPEDIRPDTAYTVKMLEESCALSTGDTSRSRFPASGWQALDAIETGSLKVTLVPVRYTGGGGELLPDTSAAVIERLEKKFMSMYPITDIEIGVREQPYEWRTPLQPNGVGWQELLMNILSLQQQEAGPGEYYYGWIAPAPSFRQYCTRGCVAGIAPVPQTNSQLPGFFGPRASAGIGIGYDTDYAANTCAHEIGHTHSMGHAPCAPFGQQPQGIDYNFPQGDASIGSWGYDILNGSLKAPSGLVSHKDVMSYCDPVWISDYTYSRFAEWIGAVNGFGDSGQAKLLGEPQPLQSIILHEDGSARWGTWQPLGTGGGIPDPATVRDASGAVVAQIEVERLQLSDDASEFILMPPAEADWAVLELSDRSIHLADVDPALR